MQKSNPSGIREYGVSPMLSNVRPFEFPFQHVGQKCVVDIHIMEIERTRSIFDRRNGQ